MRILYLYDFPLWGNGSGAYLRNLMDKVSKKHRVALVAPERRKIPKVKQFHVNPPFKLPVFVGHPELQGSKKYKDLTPTEITRLGKTFITTMLRAINDFKPDIIHLHHLGMLSSVAQYIRAIAGIDYVVTTHGSDLGNIKEDKRYYELTANTIKDAKRITAVSGYTRNWFLKMFNHHINPGLSKKVNIIPCGINIEEYKRTKGTKSIDSRYKLSGKKVALFVGRVTEEKGVEYIMRAADRIKGEVIIVGDGPEIDNLKKLKKELKLDNVHMLGYIGREKFDILRKLYTRTDVIIAPSVVHEGLPLVVLEGMCYSKPVVATRKGGIPLALKQGETGLFVKSRNSTDIAEKINILFKDEKRAKKYGENARKAIEEKFTWEKIAERFIDVYEQSIAINGNGNHKKPKRKKK